MRDSTNIQIAQAVVHIVEPHGPAGIVLSDLPLDLAGNRELHDYLVTHFTASLNDAQTKAARFVSGAAAGAAQICQALLDDPAHLVPKSKTLAQALGAIVQANRAISPGVFVVCRYTCDCSAPAPSYVALLKLDLNRLFQPKIEDRPNGLYVGCDLSSEALPSKDERLQKCAFIRSTSAGAAGWDMLLLDRQVGAGAPQPVARFFIEDFLGAELAWDPRSRTLATYNALWRVKRYLAGKVPDQQVEEFGAAIRTALRAPVFSRDAFLAAQGLSGPVRQGAEAIMVTALPDAEFETDPAVTAQLTKRMLYKGDNELLVYVDADHAERMICDEAASLPSGQLGRRVTIITRTWERVKSR